jgi:hypothetical protein
VNELAMKIASQASPRRQSQAPSHLNATIANVLYELLLDRLSGTVEFIDDVISHWNAVLDSEEKCLHVIYLGSIHASVTALSMTCRWTLWHWGQANVRRSWPLSLGSIAVNLMREPHAVHCGP